MSDDKKSLASAAFLGAVNLHYGRIEAYSPSADQKTRAMVREYAYEVGGDRFRDVRFDGVEFVWRFWPHPSLLLEKWP